MELIKLPDKTININISYLVAIIILVISLGVSYGAYRESYLDQKESIKELKYSEQSLTKALEENRLAIVALTAQVSFLLQDRNRNRR